jgi:hypothetical protein
VTRRKPARVPNRVPKARLFGRPDGFRAGPRSGWASVRGSQWPE